VSASNDKFSQIAAYVRLLVRARYRRGGVKAAVAIADVGAELGIPPSRASALYYGYSDRYPSDVDDAEVSAVCRQAAELLLREAAELRRRAAELRQQAEQIQSERSEAACLTAVSAPGGTT
jgi:hypothetical protein